MNIDTLNMESDQPPERSSFSIEPFIPASELDLQAMLVRTGLWTKRSIGRMGDSVEWDFGKVLTLCKEVEKGERTFFLIDKGTPQEKLISKLNIVVARVKCQKDGVEYMLKPGRKTIKIDDNNEIVSDKVRWATMEPGVVKGVSGKKPNQLTNDEAMVAEVSEELGKKVVIKLMKEVGKSVETKKSPGYPELETTYNKTEYDIELDESSYQEEYSELAEYRDEAGLEIIEFNVFSWDPV